MNNISLKELRLSKKLTIEQCAKIFNVSKRTIIRYENEEAKKGSFRYKQMINLLLNYNKIDEEHGILTINEIKEICNEVFEKYEIEFCYLFGSYAKGKETELSDIDLFISAPTVTGLDFFGLIEELRENLHKKVDLIDIRSLKEGNELFKEIFKDGIKIYG